MSIASHGKSPSTVRNAMFGVVAATLSSALAGCGDAGPGLDLQGSVFDALGVSTAAQEKNKKVEPKVAARPGIVLPPDPTKLPPPGSESQVAAAVPPPGNGESWPVNPEDQRAQTIAAQQQKVKEACDRLLANQRLTQQTGVVIGPDGKNCQPGLFGSIGGMFEGERK